MTADLPDLRGWLPARVLARRLGVSPGTVRARAGRGLLEVTPNPVGQGSLYRAKGRSGRTTYANGGAPALEVVPALSADERFVLGVLPSSGLGVARALGIPPGTADRRLRRLQRAGLARPAGRRPSGPRGGRPEIIWQAVA